MASLNDFKFLISTFLVMKVCFGTQKNKLRKRNLFPEKSPMTHDFEKHKA